MTTTHTEDHAERALGATTAAYRAVEAYGRRTRHFDLRAYPTLVIEGIEDALAAALDVVYLADDIADHSRDVTRRDEIACTCGSAFDLHSELYVHQATAIRAGLLGEALATEARKAPPAPGWTFRPGDVVNDPTDLERAPEGTVVTDRDGIDWVRRFDVGWARTRAFVDRTSAVLAAHGPLIVVSVGGGRS